VEAGDQDPEEAEQAQDKERVVKPERAACINSHQNACSDEHLFQCKAKLRHKRITRSQQSAVSSQTLRVVIVALLWLTAGCLADPQRTQSATLLDQLVAARAMLGEQPPRTDQACTAVGDVQTRLTGEPGLVDVQPAWSALHAAARALQALCGQNTLLDQPPTGSLALSQARERWQHGIQREFGVACDYLREAAAALDRTQPC